MRTASFWIKWQEAFPPATVTTRTIGTNIRTAMAATSHECPWRVWLTIPFFPWNALAIMHKTTTGCAAPISPTAPTPM